MLHHNKYKVVNDGGGVNKPENGTYFTVVSHELDPMTRIYPGRTEITSFYTHFYTCCFDCLTARQKRINMATWLPSVRHQYCQFIKDNF